MVLQTAPGYGGGRDSGTLAEFKARYSGCTIEEVQNEIEVGGSFDSQPSGPTSIRFVEDPLDADKYIDMRHMLVVGYEWGNLGGLGVEIVQLFRYPASAFNPQDFYSNSLGSQFENVFGTQLSNNPNFVNYLGEFLNSNYYRQDFSHVVK
jgi:hypothetical protein